MHKRQFHNKGSKYAALQDDSKSKRVKKNPIQQVVSTLPQLAISFAILFFAGTQFQSGISQVGYDTECHSPIIRLLIYFFVEASHFMCPCWQASSFVACFSCCRCKAPSIKIGSKILQPVNTSKLPVSARWCRFLDSTTHFGPCLVSLHQ